LRLTKIAQQFTIAEERVFTESRPYYDMRVLKELLLSLFVMGVVLSLYFVAAGTALVSFWGFSFHRGEPAALHDLKFERT
jgi:hypothetical protein